jgi:hypothetical protein
MDQEWWLHRKDFMAQLGTAILEKIFNVKEEEQIIALGSSMLSLLSQGQIQVYFNEPAIQSVIRSGGMEVNLEPGGGDYLYLVDSNVGFNKVDSMIQRSLEYSLELRDLSHPVGKATLVYNNQGSSADPCKQEISYGNGTYTDMQNRCYLDYWRLYVPEGAIFTSSNTIPVPGDRLLSGTGWDGNVEMVTDEPGVIGFAGLLIVPTGSTSRVEVAYSLPNHVIKKINNDLFEYILKVQVQPGLVNLPLSFKIFLPRDSIFKSMEQGWQPLDERSWEWHATLDQYTEWRLFIQIPD